MNELLSITDFKRSRSSSATSSTLEESRELFDAASTPKSLWIVHGARHQDLLAYDGNGYEKHVVEFLSKALLNSTDEPPDTNTR
jgi:hypothetical protein